MNRTSILFATSLLALTALSPALAEEAPERSIYEVCGIDEQTFQNPQPSEAEGDKIQKGIECINAESQKRLSDAGKQINEAVGEIRNSPMGGLFDIVLGELVKQGTAPETITETKPDTQAAKADPDDPCKLKLQHSASNDGVTVKMFNLLLAKNEASAYQKLSQNFKVTAPEIGFANHIDMMMWPGRRLQDAQGFDTTSASKTTCSDGTLKISEQMTFSLNGSPAADVVIETIEEAGAWKVDSIKTVKHYDLAAAK